MAASLTPYVFEGQDVRVLLDEKGEPWFVAADVLRILGVDRTSLERLDEDEKGVDSIHTPGGPQRVTVLSEPGLYSLVLGSRKPEAKRFKRWVTHDVLPAIRRTGKYEARPSLPQVPTTFAQALRLAAEQAEKLEEQQRQLEAQAPAVAAYQRYLDGTGTACIRDAAKVLELPERRFVQQLLRDKVLYRTSGGELRAYAEHQEAGRVVHRQGTGKHSERTFTQVRFTPKGLDWLSQHYRPEEG